MTSFFVSVRRSAAPDERARSRVEIRNEESDAQEEAQARDESENGNIFAG